MTFGERLRKARLDKGLTQQQLAQEIGVAKSTLTGYEKGNREPDVFKIKKIVEVLNIDSDYLILGNQKKSPAPEGTGEKEIMESAEKIYKALLFAGYVKEGQELTPAQIDFRDGLSAIISAFFDK